MNEGIGYVSATIIQESVGNFKGKDDKFLSDTFLSKLPNKKELVVDEEHTDLYKSIPI